MFSPHEFSKQIMPLIYFFVLGLGMRRGRNLGREFYHVVKHIRDGFEPIEFV